MTASSNFTNVAHAVSGVVGGATAMVILYPLEIARTRLQIDDSKSRSTHKIILEILKKEGINGLYRGLGPMLTTIAVSSFVYFYTYNGLKLIVLREAKTDVLTDLVLAFAAACVNVMVTSPMWVVNTRMKLQGAKLTREDAAKQAKVQYKGMLDALYKISRNEGLKSLWSGTLPSLVLSTNPAVQFMVYGALKRYMQLLSNTAELSGATYFVMGAVAKMVATFVTYPIQIIQTRSRFTEGHKGLFTALVDLVNEYGLCGLYRGLGAKLSQTVLNSAIMFLLYEKILHFIFRVMGRTIEN
ncbi:peroxisomal membrane protein PMP34-like isoform X1 [Tubulanus polymorphus]|uniref:peroxisomal membrane protein PMP34-like isoform X1 n=1 Tax=Tubulanus polymorphus TaxID=672921 RepID=UPI003DA475B6